MRNMPILYENCLLQFDTDQAKQAWIWYAESRDEPMTMLYKADAYAREVDDLVKFLLPLIEMRLDCAASENLMRFILKRHANYMFGGNVKMWFD